MKKSGEIKQFDFAVSECEELKPLVNQLYHQLSTVYECASGNLKYDDPSYLDGPDFVLEYHGKYANLVIAPKSFSANFPLVITENNLISTIKGCHKKS